MPAVVAASSIMPVKALKPFVFSEVGMVSWSRPMATPNLLIRDMPYRVISTDGAA